MLDAIAEHDPTRELAGLIEDEGIRFLARADTRVCDENASVWHRLDERIPYADLIERQLPESRSRAVPDDRGRRECHRLARSASNECRVGR